MKILEVTRLIRDRPYSGRLRETKPNQDREIRLTHTEDGFGSVEQKPGTIHGWHYLRINAKTGLRRLREN